MKGRIFEIKKFAVHDGDGIRTVVFLKGCPLKCVWCHNPEGIQFEQQISFLAHQCIQCGACVTVCPNGAHFFENGEHKLNRKLCVSCGRCEQVCAGHAIKLYGKEMSVDEILPILLEDKDFYDNTGGGVTLSGGECLMQADFCAKLLQRLKEEGVHTAVDTCGFIPREVIDKVLPYTDIFLYDIKAFDDSVHMKCTGQSNQIILDNLRYIDQCKISTEIRIPYVPGYNDDQMEKIAQFLKELNYVTKVRVLPYHNYAGSKYESLNMRNYMPERVPNKEDMDKAVQRLQACGHEIL